MGSLACEQSTILNPSFLVFALVYVFFRTWLQEAMAHEKATAKMALCCAAIGHIEIGLGFSRAHG
jgi:hypothetical protein